MLIVQQLGFGLPSTAVQKHIQDIVFLLQHVQKSQSAPKANTCESDQLMYGGIEDLIVPTKSLVSSNSGNFGAKTDLREALECFEEKYQALCGC